MTCGQPRVAARSPGRLLWITEHLNVFRNEKHSRRSRGELHSNSLIVTSGCQCVLVHMEMKQLILLFCLLAYVTAQCTPTCVHGACINRACDCSSAPGWTGQFCEVGTTQNSLDNRVNFAFDSGLSALCFPACQAGGICTGPNTCDCTGTGFSGAICYQCTESTFPCVPATHISTAVCTPQCVHGVCSGPNSCDCTGTGYTGATCELRTSALSLRHRG